MRGILSLCLFFGMSAMAQEGVEYSFDGEFQLRYFLDSEADGVEKSAPSTESRMEHQFRLGANFRSGERFTARLGLSHFSIWGHSDFKSGANSDSGDSRLGSFDGTNGFENTLLVTEAYGNWLVTDAFSIRAGRQLYNLAKGHVISTNEYEGIRSSVEGGIFTYHSEVASLQIIGVSLADWSSSVARENGSIPASDPEANMYGLAFDINSKPFFVKELNVHVLQINKDELNTGEVDELGESVDSRESLFRYGLHVTAKASYFTFGLDFAAHTGEQEQNLLSGGENIKRSAHMLDTNLGLSFEDWMGFKFYFGYHTDTGDDVNTAGKNEGYDPFLYNRHYNAGQMDILRWGNLSYYQLGVGFKPWDDVRLKIDYYVFSRTSVDAPVYTLAGGSQLSANPTSAAEKTTNATQNDEADLGSELDMTIVREYDGGFSMSFRYSFFIPGSYFEKGDGVTAGPSQTFSQFNFGVKMGF